MSKNLKKLILICITISTTFYFTHYLGILVRPIDTDHVISSFDTFHEMPKNSVEVIGYGSSHIFRGLNTMEMYKKYGVAAYNYGGHWQHMNTTLLFLKDSLKTQSPKVVLIETYLSHEILTNSNVNGEIYYTKKIGDYDSKKEYLSEVFGNEKESYFSYYFPLWAFHDNWINIKEGNFYRNSNKIDYKKTMGFLPVDKVKKVNLYKYHDYEQLKLPEETIEIFDEIIKLSKQYNFKIIFYTAPYQGKYKYSKALKEYAKNNNIVYLDLFEKIDEIGIDQNNDYSDNSHLNTMGATKMADYLGKYLKENYDLTDMRTVKNNIWQQNLK